MLWAQWGHRGQLVSLAEPHVPTQGSRVPAGAGPAAVGDACAVAKEHV